MRLKRSLQTKGTHPMSSYIACEVSDSETVCIRTQLGPTARGNLVFIFPLEWTFLVVGS